MKVKITLTVNINPDAWDLNYGTGTTAKAIREDVRVYVETTVHGQLEHVGVLEHV